MISDIIFLKFKLERIIWIPFSLDIFPAFKAPKPINKGQRTYPCFPVKEPFLRKSNIICTYAEDPCIENIRHIYTYSSSFIIKISSQANIKAVYRVYLSLGQHDWSTIISH